MFIINETTDMHIAAADGPGSVHLTCLAGHHGSFLCRIFCGVKSHYKPGKPFYYPALLKPHNYAVAGSDRDDGNVYQIGVSSQADYDEKLAYLMGATSERQYKRRCLQTGISIPLLLMGLPPQHRLQSNSSL
jgi:hypothetical protein